MLSAFAVCNQYVLGFVRRDTIDFSSLQCCDLLHVDNVVIICHFASMVKLFTGQGSLAGLLLFALTLRAWQHDKCPLSCVKRYTIHFLKCLHSGDMLHVHAVILWCHKFSI